MQTLLRHVRYALSEALAGLARGWRPASLAVLTIVGAVFVLGTLLIASNALQRVGDSWRDAATMAVYIERGTAAAARERIAAAIGANPAVRAHRFVSPEQAAARFSRAFP